MPAQKNKKGEKRPAFPPWMTVGLSYGEVVPPPVRPAGTQVRPPSSALPPIYNRAPAPTTTPAPVATAGYQYPVYLPLAAEPATIPTAPTTAAPTTAATQRTALTPARAFGRWGYGAGYVLDPANYGQDPGRQYAPPGTTQQPTGTGGGKAKAQTVAAPPGVDPKWYAEFQKEHEGQTPEQYYAPTDEGLPHAMADEEWARGFAEMYGRPPNEHDWRAHWFSSRTGATPEQRDKWKMQKLIRQELRKQQQQQPEEVEQRPPVWQPPMIIWR